MDDFLMVHPRRHDNWELLSDWQFVRSIGRGAQGWTYLAQHRETGRPVAVKQIRVEGDDALHRLEREARVLQSLDHEGIPQFIDSVERRDADGVRWFFLLQEYVDGVSLLDRIEAGEHLSSDAIETLLERLLEILAYLHGRSPPIVHRDVKPANILWTDDKEVRLVDFGAARAIDAEAGESVVGTAGYVAPEQFFGDAVPASDLYGVGATILHIASHRHPADFPMENLRLRIDKRVGLSRPLIRYVERLLEPDPEDRYADGTEALAELENLDNLPSVSTEGERPYLDVKRGPNQLKVSFKSSPARRHWYYLGTIGAFVLILLAVVFGLSPGSFPIEFLVTLLVVAGLQSGTKLLAIVRSFYRTELTLDSEGWTVERYGVLGKAWTKTGETSGALEVLGDERAVLVDYEGPIAEIGCTQTPGDRELLHTAIRGFVEDEKVKAD